MADNDRLYSSIKELEQLIHHEFYTVVKNTDLILRVCKISKVGCATCKKDIIAPSIITDCCIDPTQSLAKDKVMYKFTVGFVTENPQYGGNRCHILPVVTNFNITKDSFKMTWVCQTCFAKEKLLPEHFSNDE